MLKICQTLQKAGHECWECFGEGIMQGQPDTGNHIRLPYVSAAQG